MGLDKVKTRNYLVALWNEIYDRCENAESIFDIFDAVDRTMASAIEKVG
jgi:TolB-like protein